MVGRLRPCTHDPRDRQYPLRTPLDYCPRSFALDGFRANPVSSASCAVDVCAMALEYCLARRGMADFRASRLFVYYNACNATNSDNTLRDVCKAVSKFGACEERLWPWRRALLGRRPPAHLYAAARRIPPCTYARVPQTLPHIVACLLQHRPIMMGMAEHGDDRPLGARAVLLCGYDLDSGRFAVRRGDAGRFEVPHAHVLDRRLCWDLWTLA